MKINPQKLIFVIPEFNFKKHHEPQQQFHLFLNQLKKNPHYSISILTPLQSINLKAKPDHIYIVANYLSALIYLLLLPRNIPKTIYLAKLRLSFKHYLQTLPQLNLSYLKPFYLLSTLNLKPVYSLLAKTHQLTRFVFPHSTSLNQALPSLPSSIPTSTLPPPLKSITKPTSPPLWPKKPQEKWLTCSGTALLGRGLPLLISTFKTLHQQNPNLKLILLLLNAPDSQTIINQLKTLPKNSYHYHLGRLKPNQYFSTLTQADIYLAPFNFYYAIADRPATLIEAMSLNLPVITSTLATDPIFKHNFNCLKFKAHNSRSLQQQINRLLTQPGLKKQLTTNAQATINQQANFTTIYQNHFLPFIQSSSPTKEFFDHWAKDYGSWFNQSLATKHIDKMEKTTLTNILKTITPPLSIAEFGIGTARLAKHLINQLHPKTYLGLDISPEMLNQTNQLKLKNLKTILLTPSTRLPKNLNAILSFRQIKYHPRYYQQLKQMTAMLKQNGRLIIEIPSCFSVSFFGQLLSSQKHLTRLINPFKLSRQLKSLGFSQIKLIPLRFLPDNLYVSASSPASFQALTILESILKKLLPPVFAKSLIITAKKAS
jgi:glycosyltransferase involved in cell wall biosynthesis